MQGPHAGLVYWKAGSGDDTDGSSSTRLLRAGSRPWAQYATLTVRVKPVTVKLLSIKLSSNSTSQHQASGCPYAKNVAG